MATMGRCRKSSRSPSGVFATRSASANTSSGKRSGMPYLWIAIRLTDFASNGSPRTSVTFALVRGPRPEASASTNCPALASPTSEIGVSRRMRLSTGRSQKRPLASASTPSSWSSAFASFFIGCATWPLPASSVRARIRSPTPSAPLRPRSITRSRGGGTPSACQFSGTAITCSSSALTILSTVTLGSPPILWKARPGALSISPSSAMSLSRALSATLSAPCNPNARAISRFPAGPGEEVMNSMIWSRLGRPGAWRFGIIAS